MLIASSLRQKFNMKMFGIHLAFVFFFAILYYIVRKIEIYYDMEHFESKIKIKDHYSYTSYHPFISCLYFSLVTHTTVGYGHQQLPTYISQLVNMAQLFSVIFLVCYL